jgi:glycogen synthase
MKVLMFGWEFPPFISGGLGTACYGITKGLSHHGVEVTFVLPTKRGGQNMSSHVRALAADEILFSADFEKVISKKEFERRVKDKATFSLSPYFTQTFYQEIFQHMRDLKRSLSERKKSSILDFTGNYGRNLFAEVNGFAVIGEFLGLTEQFDVIHAHDWLTYLAGVGAKKMSGKPLVVHVHATEFDRSGENINQDVYNIERYGMENADKIITVSHYTKSIVVKRYGVNPDKVEVVHNAVSKDRLFDRTTVRRVLKEKIVLFLGRVTMQKGPDYFIEAANLVLKKIKNARFVMVGSGDMLHRIINRMAYLKIADRFHFTGFLKGADVERIYAMSDLYVMPSVSEPFGISPFEALLYDIPVIISKQSGVAEVLKSAVLVDFWDVQKLADKIVSILKDEKLAKAVVEKCRNEIQDIAWETAGYKIKAAYESLAR